MNPPLSWENYLGLLQIGVNSVTLISQKYSNLLKTFLKIKSSDTTVYTLHFSEVLPVPLGKSLRVGSLPRSLTWIWFSRQGKEALGRLHSSELRPDHGCVL